MSTSKTHKSEAETEVESSENDETPKKLSDFGYSFVNGKMVDDKGEGFKFAVYDSQAKNQERYEKIGDFVTEEVYKLLESQGNLIKTLVPFAEALKAPEKCSFVYRDRNLNSSDKICIFLNGAGVVRAGQWTRKLIMNNGLEFGTMLPYIERVQQLGYAVLCMNTNQRGILSTNPTQHGVTTWRDLIQNSAASKIVIIAHSAGGGVMVDLADEFPKEFITRVKGVYLTDSAHGMLTEHTEVNLHLSKIAKNYAASLKPGGTPLGESQFSGIYQSPKTTTRIPRFSAGHDDHIWTSHYAQEHIFKDLEALENAYNL